MNTPVLFLIFNRPNTTKKVFEEIRKAKPEKLFVAADGPRDNKPGEKERCKETRKITEKIDWPCDVERLYRKENLGCKLGVSSAITWFFDNVEEGIILEDDCLPHQSFFNYCTELLGRYRNCEKIMHIGSESFVIMRNRESYYFSRYPHIWGWATWRRAWKKYDIKMSKWPESNNSITKNYSFNLLDRLYWKTIFDKVKNNEIDTWDYQWVYSIWSNQGFSISPTTNLIKNLGFSSNATHTRNKKKIFLEMTRDKIKIPLVHPRTIIFNNINDKNTVNKIFKINLIMDTYLLLTHFCNLVSKKLIKTK